MSGIPLDLSGADTSGLEPVPSGKYPVDVFEAEVGETAGNPGAKLPKGTPMLKVHFRIPDDHEYKNRRFFGNYPIEFPEDYDKDKVAKMKGNLVNLIISLGYDKAEVEKGKFKLDPDDLVGRSCTAIVGIQPSRDDPDEKVNVLKGVKPIDALNTAAPTDLL